MKYFKKFFSANFIAILFFISPSIQADRTNSIRALFSWAETTHSSLFVPSLATIQGQDVWTYSYYPQTKTYLGVNDNDEVWVKGSVFGGLLYINTLSHLLNQIGYKDSIAENYIESLEFNGTILVKKNNVDILRKGFGYSNKTGSLANDIHTRFRIGSLTKAFTALSIV